MKYQKHCILIILTSVLTGCNGDKNQETNGNIDQQKSGEAVEYIGRKLISNECVGHSCIGEDYQNTLNFYAAFDLESNGTKSHTILVKGQKFLQVVPDEGQRKLRGIWVYSPAFSTLTKEHVGTTIEECMLLEDDEPVYWDKVRNELYIAPQHLSKIDKATGKVMNECRLYFGEPKLTKDFPRPIQPFDQEREITMIALLSR